MSTTVTTYTSQVSPSPHQKSTATPYNSLIHALGLYLWSTITLSIHDQHASNTTRSFVESLGQVISKENVWTHTQPNRRETYTSSRIRSYYFPPPSKRCGQDTASVFSGGFPTPGYPVDQRRAKFLWSVHLLIRIRRSVSISHLLEALAPGHMSAHLERDEVMPWIDMRFPDSGIWQRMRNSYEDHTASH